MQTVCVCMCARNGENANESGVQRAREKCCTAGFVDFECDCDWSSSRCEMQIANGSEWERFCMCVMI